MTAEQTAQDCLRRLGVNEPPACVAVLADGPCPVFRASLAGHDVLLRHTPAAAPQPAQEFARREIQFHAKLAAQIPLSAPRLQNSAADDTGICAMWAAPQPTPPAGQWAEADFLEAASDLANLHTAFWGRTDRLADFAFLRRPTPELIEDEIRASYAAWRALAAQERYAAILTGQMLGQIRALLLNFAHIERALRATPATLVHGACAPANLFRGAGGQLSWWGWGNAGVGRAAQDVSALLLTAREDGAEPPAQKILGRYQAQVKTVLGDEFSMVAFLRATDAAELQARLLRGPSTLANAPAQRAADFVHRISQLAKKINLA